MGEVPGTDPEALKVVVVPVVEADRDAVGA